MERRLHISTKNLLLSVAPIPVWGFVALVITGASGWRSLAGAYFFLFVVLTALTWAFYFVTKRWMVAAILAPAAVWITLAIAARIIDSQIESTNETRPPAREP